MKAKKSDDPTPEPTTDTISKTEAIKRALAAGHTKPQTAVVWIKEQFGLDVTANVFSTTRYTLGKRANKTSRPAPVEPTTPAPVSGLELVKQVKVLVDRFGASQVKEAASIFG